METIEVLEETTPPEPLDVTPEKPKSEDTK